MASKTPNLGLIKPNKGEYFNTWNVPMNKNLDIIDENLGGVLDEVTTARGSQATLGDRLDNGLDSNGFIKSPTELINARSSTIYGSDDGTTDYTLDTRIEQGEKEIWHARQQQSKLMDALAWAENGNVQNTVLSAATNYITFAGAVVTANGLVTPVEANINGYRQQIRTNKTVTISGGSGTYYVYLQRNPAGEIFYTIPAASGSVATYTPTSKLSKFVTGSGNFVTAGVKPGDIIKLTAPLANPNLGEFVVHSTNVEDPSNLNPNELRIVGEFATASTGIDAQLINTLAPTLGFQSSPHAKKFTVVANKIYIARVIFDGSNVNAVLPYALRGIYDAFTSVTANFQATISHYLGYIPSRIYFYGSQANDYSQPLEVLSSADMSDGAASITTGSVGTTPAIVNFNPGTTSLTPNTPQVLTYVAPTLGFTDMVVTYTPPVITYTAPILRRSIRSRFNDITIEVRNSGAGIFYVDYDGTTQVSGYVRVVCER